MYDSEMTDGGAALPVLAAGGIALGLDWLLLAVVVVVLAAVIVYRRRNRARDVA